MFIDVIYILNSKQKDLYTIRVMQEKVKMASKEVQKREQQQYAEESDMENVEVDDIFDGLDSLN